jgi:hypothetical protein
LRYLPVSLIAFPDGLYLFPAVIFDATNRVRRGLVNEIKDPANIAKTVADAAKRATGRATANKVRRRQRDRLIPTGSCVEARAAMRVA